LTVPQAIKKHAEERMEKAIAALKRDLATLRAGRATPAILDRVQAEYYGTPTPVNQLGSITTPDSRTLVIQPWDKSALAAIEKAILKSDVGLTPANDGTIIRLVVPPLTEERRADLVKSTKKFGEEAKVAIRNIRRDANDDIKKLEKSEISEDESRRHQEDVQKLTDRFVAEVDKILAAKEKEIMEV
jgi:ribosome recycling factor